MKYIFLLLAVVCLTSCAPASNGSQTFAIVSPETKAPCRVYDSCTYIKAGWGIAPEYDCESTTLQEADHQEIPASYFDSNGSSCLTYKEDHNSGQQGPGPLALPEFNL